MVFWYAFGLILCLIVVCEYYAFKTGVPTVTSTPAVRRKMIELLKKEAARRRQDKPFTILDLGSGTGKLTLEIAKALPQARITGIEISIIPFWLSKIRKWFWRDKRVTYKRENFWAYDLAGVDAVVIYMTAKIRDRMAVKLKEDLPKGALIIINETHLPDWKPVEVHEVGLFKVKVVAYRQS